MSLVEYFNSNSPITNLPDLLNLHHSNPLGIDYMVQIIAIFVLVEVMALVNYMIRYRDKSNLYPALYTLLGVVLVMIYYYCFQDTLPLQKMHTILYSPTEGTATMAADIINPNLATGGRPAIGWFCYPEIVGWPIAIVSLILLTQVIFCILSACMQVAAQLSVEAKLIEGKPWKEWKVAVFILLIGVLLTALAAFISPYATTWTLFGFQIVLLGFIIYKIVADSIRCQNVGWGLLIGLTFYAGILACMMLSLECLRGAIFFIVVLAAFLTNAKARKKKVKK